MSGMAVQRAPDAAQLTTPIGQKLWQSARDFEAMALGPLLEPMFATIDQSKGMFGGGDGEQAWRPMMVQAVAKQMASAGGIGIAMPVFAQLLRQQEATQISTGKAIS